MGWKVKVFNIENNVKLNNGLVTFTPLSLMIWVRSYQL